MQGERRKKAERDPSSKYKFVPTEEEWTWERKDEGPSKIGTTMGANAEYGTGGGRAADQGWEWGGIEDGGWEGMRARRTLNKVVGNIERWKTVGARGNKGKGRDVGSIASQGASADALPSQSGHTSQANHASAHSRRNSRTRQETTAGRQSVLGDYWNWDSTPGEEQTEVQQGNSTPSVNLC